MLTAVVSLAHRDFLAFFRSGKSEYFVTFFLFFKPEEFIFPHIQKGQRSSRLGMRAHYWIENKNDTVEKEELNLVRLYSSPEYQPS